MDKPKDYFELIGKTIQYRYPHCKTSTGVVEHIELFAGTTFGRVVELNFEDGRFYSVFDDREWTELKLLDK